MKYFKIFSRLCLLAIMSFTITSAASAAGTSIYIDQSNPIDHSYQSFIHKIHSVTINEDGSRTVRHCKIKTECRYCTKKCLAPTNCIAKDCCTQWSKSECRIGAPPKDAAPSSLN